MVDAWNKNIFLAKFRFHDSMYTSQLRYRRANQ
jgi:hypothetical protein